MTETFNIVSESVWLYISADVGDTVIEITTVYQYERFDTIFGVS